MTLTQPPFGLLLDVDGPIASPVTRRIDIPSIAQDLADLANAGIPVAFNTGRSLDFIAENVIPPLATAGLRDTARVHSIAEKGGAWARIHPGGHGETTTDPSIHIDPRFAAAMRALVADRFSDTMFFDDTKVTMVSVEMIAGSSDAAYHAAQREFDAAALAALGELGYGVTTRGIDYPNAEGLIHIRIDPTIISTDIELVETGKALGAQRALELFSADGPIPETWYTVGDAPSDYRMADWLHENGYTVTHVDVRPVENPLRPDYPVRIHDGVTNDASAAILFRELATSIASQ